MFLQLRRIGSIETLEQRQLMAGDTFGAVIPDVEPAAMIFVQIPGMGDDSIQTKGYDDRANFIADSFTFGVEREMKESGEKGGTEDINIGVGELQECTVSKSMDWSSPLLTQYAINGNSPGQAEIDFVEVAGGGDAAGEHEAKHLAFAELENSKLDRCFVKSWSVSGDADDRPTEEVAFYYNKSGFSYAKTADGKEW